MSRLQENGANISATRHKLAKNFHFILHVQRGHIRETADTVIVRYLEFMKLELYQFAKQRFAIYVTNAAICQLIECECKQALRQNKQRVRTET